jgi:tetratricopeptide (TPR) repeat protein
VPPPRLSEGLENLIARLHEVANRGGERANSEMRRIYHRIVKEYPREPDAWLLLADMHRDDGALRPLVMAARRAVALAPTQPHVLVAAADRLLAGGAADEAEAHLKRARARAPADDPAWLAHMLTVTGTLYEVRREFDKAEKAYRQALETVPEDEYLWFLLAWFLTERGRITEARSVASEGLRRFPGDDALLDLRRSLRSR